MPLEVPNLDDRRWDALVEDARALIPRVAPRWTDHNVHDPGITFIELFAWLAEMQIYQLNRVGERHRENFAQLVGVRRQRGVPARVDVQAIGQPSQSAVIARGTQLVPVEGEELVFETTIELTLTRSRLERVVVVDDAGPIDQTEANAKRGIVFLVFGETGRTGAELRLGFDRFYPIEERQIRLTAEVVTEDLFGRCESAVPVPIDEDAAQDAAPPVELSWEYLAAGGQWLPLDASDDTRAFSRSGAITLSVPSQAVPEKGQVWIRSRIARGYYDIEPRLRHITVNVLPCLQQETVRDERLQPGGNGRPDQVFELAKRPVLLASDRAPVVVTVGDETWTYVTSLEGSSPSAPHYTFDPKRASVTFGNGVNGRVPESGQSIRAVEYRTTAGRSGNVASGLPWRFRTAVVPGVTLINFRAAQGGADPEPLDQMELRMRALLNRPHRAVTLSDFERLALGTPHAHVARAKAIADCPLPGAITVVAVPKVRPGRTHALSRPSETFLNSVRRHLQRRRLIGDNVRVVGPAYIEVSVEARLRLTRGAGETAVVERARRALAMFLAGEGEPPATTSDIRVDAACPTRWPFGRWVFPSEIYAVLDRVSGVDSVTKVVLRGARGGVAVAPDATGAIPVPRVGLILAGRHQLTIEPDVRRRG
jgi:predicted phage baseplate assembly protein